MLIPFLEKPMSNIFGALGRMSQVRAPQTVLAALLVAAARPTVASVTPPTEAARYDGLTKRPT